MLKIASLCAVLMLVGGTASAAETPPKIVALQRLVDQIPPGEDKAVLRIGLLCETTAVSGAQGSSGDVKVGPFLDGFRKSFSEAGLHPQGEENLFEENPGGEADYALAGVVKAESYDLCARLRRTALSGQGAMTIDWQLYSRLEKRVVAKAHIVSHFKSEGVLSGDPAAFQNRTMIENFKLLALDPDIRAALAGAGASKDEMITPVASSTLTIEGARVIQPRPIDQASQSVVMIFAGQALGSGVLISRDGYILTDAHVVGDATSVRLRWGDGKESIGAVIRASKPRDVALIKTDAKGHDPLPMRYDAPGIGDTVFAIGSPEGQQFAGTLTRGVVSAIRPLNGLNYIQSDVTTGHGGSGGPLLDDKGYVVGLTDLGFGHEATSSGLNFFTPIKDAVAFLGLDIR